jgi:murein DD-endopeptidase MepM/ murein hydrolase activator NlpD
LHLVRTETSVRFPVWWGVQQAVAPVLVVVAVLWVASPALTVRWVWNVSSPESSSRETKLAMPVQGVDPSELSDSYLDPRSDGRIHRAIDIFAPIGTPVRAAANGTVVRRSTETLGGNAVYVLTPDSTTVHYYAHLSTVAPGIREGVTVETGDRLGTVGATGNATSYHLHFAVWKQTDPGPPYADEPVNPYPLLTR